MIVLRSDKKVPHFYSPHIERAGGVLHGFSTRLGGVSEGPYGELNLSFRVGDHAGRVEENRRRFFGLFSIAPEQVLTARQVHGTHVAVLDSFGAERSSPATPVAGRRPYHE